MISPTDITKEAVVAAIKASGPSSIKDITCRVLGLPPGAARRVTRTHTKHYSRIYGLLRTLVATGVVATQVSDALRSKNERRGAYYLPDHNQAEAGAAVSERQVGGTASVVVSGGSVFATRQDGVVFRYAPVPGDPNGEWRWQRLPDLPQD